MSDWRERVFDAVKPDARPPRYLIQSLMDESLRPLIKEAAKRRGIPVSHYYRRAVLSFVAHDLDIDFEELAQFEPPIPEGEGLTPRKMRGRGFGKWRIGRLDK